MEGISKVSITPYMEHIFAELKDSPPNIAAGWATSF